MNKIQNNAHQKLQKKIRREDPRFIGFDGDYLVCVWRSGTLKSNTYALGFYPREFLSRYGPDTVVKWVVGSSVAKYMSRPGILHEMFPDDADRQDIIKRLQEGRFDDYPRLTVKHIADSCFDDMFELTVGDV